MRITLFFAFFLGIGTSLFAQKQVYIPRFITNTNMNLNDPNSQWCYCRSMETENIIVFWEPGFGSNPSNATGSYKVNMTDLIREAEKSYNYYLDSLQFAIKGSSVTDKNKLMIFLLYSTEWAAYGSGQDNKVGTLHVNPAAAREKNVLAHEIGHCFEYITGCDSQGGYQYGFGPNASGGNGFWEQCAQWMAYKVYPEMKFSGDFNEYIKNNHLHIIHETPRYANYFVQDYWTYKRGKKFMGKLWRDSRKPEDPIETYKRINSITQSQFNDEMYEHAALLTTWDIAEIRSYGKNFINRRAQVKMNATDDNYWKIDPSVCIENYGYNSIKLNVPSQQTEVKVNFKGLAGTSGFRALNTNQGGWRYGFVALLENGTRVYSNMASANVTNGNNPENTLSFTCPDKCINLWLVVSGSPQTHWKHAWDDDNTNDEQWPYQVKFENTNLLGVFNNPIHDATLTYNVLMDPASDYTPLPVSLNASLIGEAFSMSPQDIANALGSTITYYGVNPDGSLNATSTANIPGHWYNKAGQTIAWGDNAYVFSELNIANMVVNIGQFPDRTNPGDQYTIRQALVYKKSATETAQVTLVFNITIQNDILTGSTPNIEFKTLEAFPNPTSGIINFTTEANWVLTDVLGHELMTGSGKSVDLSAFAKGLYLLKVDGGLLRVIRE